MKFLEKEILDDPHTFTSLIDTTTTLENGLVQKRMIQTRQFSELEFTCSVSEDKDDYPENERPIVSIIKERVVHRPQSAPVAFKQNVPRPQSAPAALRKGEKLFPAVKSRYLDNEKPRRPVSAPLTVFAPRQRRSLELGVPSIDSNVENDKSAVSLPHGLKELMQKRSRPNSAAVHFRTNPKLTFLTLQVDVDITAPRSSSPKVIRKKQLKTLDWQSIFGAKTKKEYFAMRGNLISVQFS